MPETLKITGGTRLQGEVTPVTNKNAILSAFPASLLTDQTVTYHNIPATTDVKKFLEILSLLGADIDDSDYTNLKINTKNINSYKVDLELGNQIRASIMLAGPLLARFGIAEIPTPGGCVLGKRSIMAHIDTFSKAGIKFETQVQIKRFTIDFIIPEKKIAIEADGIYWHNKSQRVKERDERKNALLESQGFRVVRLKEEEIVDGKFREVLNQCLN